MTDGQDTPIGVQEYERLVKKLRHQLSSVSDDNMYLDKMVDNLKSEVERLRAELAEAKDIIGTHTAIISLKLDSNAESTLANELFKALRERDSLREQAKERNEVLAELTETYESTIKSAYCSVDGDYELIEKAKAVLEKYKP